MKRFNTVVVFFIIFVFWAPAARASNMFNKLARGVINIPTSVVELPMAYSTSYAKLKEHAQRDPLDFATPAVQTPYQYLVRAPLTGISRMIGRIFVGCYEIVTFPFSFPRYYAPVIEPEFVFDTMPYSFKLYDQGIVCMNRGKYKSAIGRFSEVLKLEPENAQALYYRGRAYERVDQYSRSVDDIQLSEKLGFHPELENIQSLDEKY
jgi:tetratricopeptide (TPR) repeat protein